MIYMVMYFAALKQNRRAFFARACIPDTFHLKKNRGIHYRENKASRHEHVFAVHLGTGLRLCRYIIKLKICAFQICSLKGQQHISRGCMLWKPIFNTKKFLKLIYIGGRISTNATEVLTTSYPLPPRADVRKKRRPSAVIKYASSLASKAKPPDVNRN